MATAIKPIKSIKKNQFTPKIRGKSNRALSNIGKTNLSLFFLFVFAKVIIQAVVGNLHSSLLTGLIVL